MNRRQAPAALAILVMLGACSLDKAKERAEPVPEAAGGGEVKLTPTIAPSPAEGGTRSTTAATVAATPQADPTRVVAVADVPDTVTRGTATTAVFLSRPGNMCQLELRYGDGRSGQRLPPATTDASGHVSWSWEIAPDAIPGQATAYVVCSGGNRGEARITIVG